MTGSFLLLFIAEIYFMNHSPTKLVLQSSEIQVKLYSKSVVFHSNTHPKSENSSQILKTRSNFWCLGVINKQSRWGEVGFGIWLKQHGKIPNPTSPQRDVCYNNLCYHCHCTATLLLGWVTPLLLFPFSWSCTQPPFSWDFLCGIFIPIFFLIGLSLSLGFMLMHGFCTKIKTLPNTIFQCLCVPCPCPCIRPPEATNWLCDIHLLGGTDTLKITKIANLTNPQCKNVVTNSW